MMQQILSAIPPGGSLAMSISRPKEGQALVSVRPNYPKDADVNLRPFSVGPGPEEEVMLKIKEGLEVMSGDMTALNTSIEAVREQIQEQAARKAAQAKGGKVDRMKGEPDDKVLESLASGSPGQEAWRKALGEANLATLEAVLPKADRVDVLEGVSKEIKKVKGEAPTSALEGRLRELYAEYKDLPGKRDTVAKALEKLTGKTLAELGLAPSQNSMFAGGE